MNNSTHNNCLNPEVAEKDWCILYWRRKPKCKKIHFCSENNNHLHLVAKSSRKRGIILILLQSSYNNKPICPWFWYWVYKENNFSTLKSICSPCQTRMLLEMKRLIFSKVAHNPIDSVKRALIVLFQDEGVNLTLLGFERFTIFLESKIEKTINIESPKWF